MEAKLVTGSLESVPAERESQTLVGSFDQIVFDHQRRIHRILLSLLHDADAADTLTQEVFLRAFRGYAMFRREASVGTWLVRIAINLAMDHVRNRRVAFWRRLVASGAGGESGSYRVVDPAPLPDRTAIARERLAAVRDAVGGLSRRQRACFLLRFIEGMSLEEIAEAMEIEVGTVKAHLARAVGRVRSRLAEREEPCEDI